MCYLVTESPPTSINLERAAHKKLHTLDLGIVFGIASGLTPFLMIPAGYLNDRYGPKPGILLGGIAIGLGYIFASAATSTAMLIASYGILVGGGTGLVNGCTINSSVKLFPDKRGLAGGVVTAALGP